MNILASTFSFIPLTSPFIILTRCLCCKSSHKSVSLLPLSSSSNTLVPSAVISSRANQSIHRLSLTTLPWLTVVAPNLSLPLWPAQQPLCTPMLYEFPCVSNMLLLHQPDPPFVRFFTQHQQMTPPWVFLRQKVAKVAIKSITGTAP